MKLIFDIGRMRDALLEFEIDLTKVSVPHEPNCYV